MKLIEFYDNQIGEREGSINKFLNKWVFTVDHKTIGSMYITFSILAGIIGTLLSLIIRLELSTGNMLEGDSQQYNVIVTAHGLIMIFFVVKNLKDISVVNYKKTKKKIRKYMEKGYENN